MQTFFLFLLEINDEHDLLLHQETLPQEVVEVRIADICQTQLKFINV